LSFVFHFVLFGCAGEEQITALELAERSGTIPYEIFTRIGKRVVRVYRGGAERPQEKGFTIVRRPAVAESSRTRR
jgi:hypothetical protein